MELVHALGIDWRLLIAQIVNFLILMGALSFILYKPLIAVLEKRRTRIEESMVNAERIGAELKRTGAEQARILSEARIESQRIITEATERAETQRNAVLERAKAEVASIVAQSKIQLSADREQLVREVRAQAAELVALATEKVIGEKMTAAKDKALIERVMEQPRV
jgi:F-type H+-transporting ATPase subunit b